VVERAYVNLTLPEGWRLARGYGSEVAAFGRSVNVPVGALFAGEERRLVLDLVVDPAQAQRAHGDGHAGAVVARLGYHDVRSNAPSTHDLGALAMGVARSDADALASRDVVVFAEAEGTVIAARQADAVVAWRTGNAGEAASIAQRNLRALRALQAAAPSPARAAQIRAYDEDNTAFNTVSGASEEGRAYGLRSNAVHRRAQRSAAAY
jgi:hypothetical protein